MKKGKNIFQFLGEKLNDKQLIEKGETLKLDNVIAKSAPKRTSTPLTNLTTRNNLEAILQISKKSKLGVEKKKKETKVVTKSAKKSTTKPKKVSKPAKAKKRK
jgi:hypothetical protein